MKALIFDLDGTLLNTLDDLADAANSMLTARDYPTHDNEAYRWFVGDGMKTLVERILPESERQPKIIDACLAEYKASYELHWNQKTVPYPGIPELLTTLVDQQTPMAILSNKAHAFTEKCVAEFLSEYPFDIVLGQRDGIEKKPDPAGAIEIANALGLPPSEIGFLGDSGVDMQTAVNAGMQAIAALWGFRTEDELQKQGAKHLVKEAQDVLALIDR